MTRIPHDLPDCRRYRIEGGTIAPNWTQSLRTRAVRRGTDVETPSCEITIWFQGNRLGSYGGVVWPSAWPELFAFDNGSAQTGPSTTVLPAGLELIAAAERRFDADRAAKDADALGGPCPSP